MPGRGQTRKEKRVHSAATAIPEPSGGMAPGGTIEIFKLFLSKVKFTSLVVKMNSFFKENNTNE